MRHMAECNMTIQLHKCCCTIQYHDSVSYLLVLIILSHSYQISFKIGMCHHCKLNLFFIMSKLSNIITLVIILLVDYLTLSRGPVML
jgi:hypothetical protein